MNARDLLERYVDLHNRGVRDGAFDALVDLFADDARFSLAGIPVGPFRGREEIGRAFSERRPDDELVLTQLEGDATWATGTYAWLARPQVVEGTIRVAVRDGLIIDLAVARKAAA